MKRTKPLFVFILIVILTVTLTFPVTAAETKPMRNASIVNEVYKLLEQYHVSSTGEDELAAAAIEGLIKKLKDPYTDYYTKEQWNGFNDKLELNYVGIGVRLDEDAQGIYIAEVFKGSPANSAGFLRGEYIRAINGKVTKELEMNDVLNLIVGTELTNVLVTLDGPSGLRNVFVRRGRVNIPIVTGEIFSNGTGYLRLESFSEKASTLFKSELDRLKEQGMKSLIIDLRNNPGGYLSTAIQIAALFIPNGPIIYTRDRNGEEIPQSVSGGTPPDYKIIVLVNENSASASEVLAGAMQDYEAAVIIGSKTFGKGSVQNSFQLSNGDVLKITIEEYLTPNKRKVNGMGLTPSVVVEGSIPQLIKAVHETSSEPIHLNISKHYFNLNGVEFPDIIPIYREEERIYVPSRILAALINGKVSWNESLKAVEIWEGTSRSIFRSGSPHVILLEGTMYLELEHFTASYPQLLWSSLNQSLQINVVKGNE